jgi:hypothetical protein
LATFSSIFQTKYSQQTVFAAIIHISAVKKREQKIKAARVLIC